MVKIVSVNKLDQCKSLMINLLAEERQLKEVEVLLLVPDRLMVNGQLHGRKQILLSPFVFWWLDEPNLLVNYWIVIELHLNARVVV